MFIHHAANVPLVVGEEDTAWAQVFCLSDLFVLCNLLYLSGRGVRWWGRTCWARAPGRNRQSLWAARGSHSVHQIPTARCGTSQTNGCLRIRSCLKLLQHALLLFVCMCMCVRVGCVSECTSMKSYIIGYHTLYTNDTIFCTFLTKPS